MDEKFLVFDEADGLKVAINPSKITSIVNVGEGFTDINFDHGRDVRVRGSFESVLARLAEPQKAVPK